MPPSTRSKGVSTPAPVTGKRSKAWESSSDFNSSGPFAGKRPAKRMRIGPSGHGRQPLAERSSNVPSIPEIAWSKPPVHPKTAAEDKSHSQNERGKDGSQRSFNNWKDYVLEALETQDVVLSHMDLTIVETAESHQEIAELISDRGWWTPILLELFADTATKELSLSNSSVSASEGPRTLLAVFFRQETFTQLSRLILKGIPLSLHDISLLRLLPQLTLLNISNTQATTAHLLHLATHAETLNVLDISGDPLIDDDCRVPLTALTKLKSLYLRDTAVTMPCLRLLVYALAPECRLMTIPQPCLDYFNDREKRYCITIPAGYVQDPRQVAGLSMSTLKHNLELHKQANKDIMLTGTRVDLVDRLKGILCARVADGRIVARVGKR